MTRWKRVGVSIAGVLLLAALGLSQPPSAEAHGRGGSYGFWGRGFYGGWGPGWGWGWGYWPNRQPRADMAFALMAGVGALDMDVKPGEAEVWADGRFVGEARDLDGDPSYLWLKQGPHHLVVYKGGYKSFEDDFEVAPGTKLDLRVRLEKGESAPPGHRPGAPQQGAAFGELRLSVQPEDASVYVDGEFRGTGRDLQSLRLRAGPHHLELVRPGFGSVQTDVDVDAGHPVDLKLRMQSPGPSA